jgi:hypothetical protein
VIPKTATIADLAQPVKFQAVTETNATLDMRLVDVMKFTQLNSRDVLSVDQDKLLPEMENIVRMPHNVPELCNTVEILQTALTVEIAQLVMSQICKEMLVISIFQPVHAEKYSEMTSGNVNNAQLDILLLETRLPAYQFLTVLVIISTLVTLQIASNAENVLQDIFLLKTEDHVISKLDTVDAKANIS